MQRIAQPTMSEKFRLLSLRPRTTILLAVASCFATASLPAVTLAAAPDRPGEAADSVSVRINGVLSTGRVAIGGETSGTVIQSKDITFELAFVSAINEDHAGSGMIFPVRSSTRCRRVTSAVA